MPQMKIKSTVTPWPNDNSSDNLKGLLKTFFNNSNVYIYGSFDENKNYNHISCNWQSDAIYCIQAEAGTNIDPHSIKFYTLDVPYMDSLNGNNDAVFIDDVCPVVGDDKIGWFPDITTDLTQKMSDLYLIEYTYNDGAWVANKKCKPLSTASGSRSVLLTSYIDGKVNEDTIVKPSSITFEKRFEIKPIDKDGDTSPIKYLIKTDQFTLRLKRASSNTITDHTVIYKIGVLPFNVNADASVDDNDVTTIVNMLSDSQLHIGDEEITLGSGKTFMFYFYKEAEGDVPYKFCRKASDKLSYYDVPTNAVFPLYYNDSDSNSDIRGIVYIQMFEISEGEEIPFSYNSKELTFESFDNSAKTKQLNLNEIQEESSGQ